MSIRSRLGFIERRLGERSGPPQVRMIFPDVPDHEGALVLVDGGWQSCDDAGLKGYLNSRNGPLKVYRGLDPREVLP